MMRIGHGYDVHRLDKNRKLVLGGVEIPHKSGLLGHSDADVLVHAVMDALLGAAALGDIGQHFPDNDDRFKDANSIDLLRKVITMLRLKGYKISNIDCTIIAQKPKLFPFINDMVNNIAQACCCEKTQVNVKATTEEYLGFTGEELGIAAHCVCIIE